MNSSAGMLEKPRWWWHPGIMSRKCTVSPMIMTLPLQVLFLHRLFKAPRYHSSENKPRMETASINDIKKTLTGKDADEVIALCLRMARYKKENKELLSYLLFESGDEQAFIEGIMKEIDAQFDALVFSTTYKYTKQVRKILRYVNKHIKYSGLATTQLDLLMYFCSHLLPLVKGRRNQTGLINVYAQQIKKINTALGKIHEDLQYDYIRQMEKTGLVWEPGSGKQ
jgi:hypothetical protein